MMTDPISDMLTRIRNANKASKEKVDIPASKMKEKIVQIFEKEGYISSYKKIEDYKQGILRVFLKYGPNKEKSITEIKRVSKPGLRIYRQWNRLPRVYRGLGIAVISTPRGVIVDSEAREQRLGGEVICTVW